MLQPSMWPLNWQIWVCVYVCNRVNCELFSTGDEIDANYRQDMNEIIELTGSPESAYTTFLYVVENMFTWDENGQGEGMKKGEEGRERRAGRGG